MNFKYIYIYIYIYIYKLTRRSIIFLKKLTTSVIVKNYTASCGTRNIHLHADSNSSQKQLNSIYNFSNYPFKIHSNISFQITPYSVLFRFCDSDSYACAISQYMLYISWQSNISWNSSSNYLRLFITLSFVNPSGDGEVQSIWSLSCTARPKNRGSIAVGSEIYFLPKSSLPVFRTTQPLIRI
jgi:hypothetical protein